MFGWLQRLRAPQRAERKLMAWHAPGRPVWSARDPSVYAREGYSKNAIAYRCVRLIAEAAASAPLKVTPSEHPLAALLARPNPEQTGVELRESFFGHLQVSGNSYLEAASADEDAPPRELYALRPDRMSVVPGSDGWPIGWEHRVGANVRRFERDALTGAAHILHLKLFHPNDTVGRAGRALQRRNPERRGRGAPGAGEFSAGTHLFRRRTERRFRGAAGLVAVQDRANRR